MVVESAMVIALEKVVVIQLMHTSHLRPHTSHLALHTSHLTPHTSHLTPHTPHLTPHTPHLIPHTRCGCVSCTRSWKTSTDGAADVPPLARTRTPLPSFVLVMSNPPFHPCCPCGASDYSVCPRRRRRGRGTQAISPLKYRTAAECAIEFIWNTPSCRL